MIQRNATIDEFALCLAHVNESDVIDMNHSLDDSTSGKETAPVRRRGDRRVADETVDNDRRKGDRRDIPGVSALIRTLFRRETGLGN